MQRGVWKQGQVGIEKLVAKLESQPQTVDDYWAEKRREWVDDLGALMTSIAEWLEPAVAKNLVRIERRKFELDEAETGPYAVDALTIHLGDREVHVEPRGMRVVGVVTSGNTRIIGARGRVDLVSGPARATILRRADRAWQLAAVDGWAPERQPIELTADALADALAELIG